MRTCPDDVKRLVDRFNQQAEQVRSPDYNETQLRIDFINPLFRLLGWDNDGPEKNAKGKNRTFAPPASAQSGYSKKIRGS